MRRPPLPTFLTDLDREPGAVQTLVAASLALLAAGLAPRIFSPGLASVQSAVRERPEIEALLLVASIVTAGMLLVGGVLGDADGRRRIMLVALGGLIVTGIGGLFFADGPLFVVGRFVDVGRREHRPAGRPGRCGDHVRGRRTGPRRSVSPMEPMARRRAAAPVLLTLFGPTGSRAPAFAAAAAAAIVAFAYSRRHWPDLPTAGPTQRVAVLDHRGLGVRDRRSSRPASSASRARSADGARVGLVAHRARPRRARVCPSSAGDAHGPAARRSGSSAGPSAIALFVGFVIAYAQTAALFQVPVYFQLVLGYGPILSVIATIPFMVALAVAGPVAGILLARFSPRTLMVGGILAVGLGSIVIAAILRPGAGYLGFAISFAMIGAGFVIATTVRTAIIFASVPRGLPATAAALNEASVALGSRAALVVVTVLVTTLALDSYAASLTGQTPGPDRRRGRCVPDAPVGHQHADLRRPHRRGRGERRGGLRRGLHRCGPDGDVQHRHPHPAGRARSPGSSSAGATRS